METSIVIAAASICTTIFIALYVRTQQRADTQVMLMRDLDTRVAKIEGWKEGQSPFFTALQSRIIDALHHPDPSHSEMDGLLEKLKALTLSSAEKARLKAMLSAQAENVNVDVTARQQSKALLAVMPLVLAEAVLDPVASERESVLPVRPTEGHEEKTP